MDRKRSSVADVNEADRLYLDKSGVTTHLKDLLAKFVDNRPENVVDFLAEYFESVDEGTDKVARARHHISQAHFSTQAYRNNVIIAYDVLADNKGASMKGINGSLYMELLASLTKSFPQATKEILLRKLQCREHELVVFDVFQSSVFICVVLQEFIKTAEELYRQIDVCSQAGVSGRDPKSGDTGCQPAELMSFVSETGQKEAVVETEGSADSNVCSLLSKQLREAVSKSAQTPTGLLDAGRALAPGTLFAELSGALPSKCVKFSNKTSRQEFVCGLAETFLSKVNDIR